MIVSNIVSNKGNDVPNQFIIVDRDSTTFQSYKSIIARKQINPNVSFKVLLDEYYWNYSRTTSKYLSMFLGESTMDIKKKIKDGTYTLTNLN